MLPTLMSTARAIAAMAAMAIAAAAATMITLFEGTLLLLRWTGNE